MIATINTESGNCLTRPLDVRRTTAGPVFRTFESNQPSRTRRNLLKTRIATALSIVGVLGAGSAAAVVNTSILDDGPVSGAPAVLIPPPAPSVPEEAELVPDQIITVVRPPQAQPAAVTDSPTQAPSPTTTPLGSVPISPNLTVFNVGVAGTVTLDVVDGRLELLSAMPNDGWAIGETNGDSDRVEVEFVSDGVMVEFSASWTNGQIATHVESHTVGSVLPSTSPSQPGEHDEDHEEEEHEDDD